MRFRLFPRWAEIPRALRLTLLFPMLPLLALLPLFTRTALLARAASPRLLARTIMQPPQGAAQ